MGKEKILKKVKKTNLEFLAYLPALNGEVHKFR